MATTWARAGLHNVDFGLDTRTRYVEGAVPCVNGCILIVDSAPLEPTLSGSTAARSWTENGVDVTFTLSVEDMDRLLRDPLLLPQVKP